MRVRASSSYDVLCTSVRCARVGSRPGPLVLSMNFIDGGDDDGSAIRVWYASMNAPQSQFTSSSSSSSSSQSVVFRFAGA